MVRNAQANINARSQTPTVVAFRQHQQALRLSQLEAESRYRQELEDEEELRQVNNHNWPDLGDQRPRLEWPIAPNISPKEKEPPDQALVLAASTRHEQPMMYEPEIKIDRPDDPENTEFTPRCLVLSAWTRDFSNGEVIPETPQESDIDEPMPMEVDSDVPDIQIISPSSQETIRYRMSNTAPSSSNSSTLGTIQSRPTSATDYRNRGSQKMHSRQESELTLRLANTSQHLRRLLQMIPINDPSREIFHAAYHQATFMLVSGRLARQGISWSQPDFERDVPAFDIADLTQDRLYQLRAAADQLLTNTRPVRRTKKRRKKIPTELMETTLSRSSTYPAELTAASTLASMSNVHSHQFVDDVVMSSNALAVMEPRPQRHYSPMEVIDMLRDMRDETASSDTQRTSALPTSALNTQESSETISTSESTTQELDYIPLSPPPRNTGLVPGDDSEPGTFKGFHRVRKADPPIINRPPTPYPKLIEPLDNDDPMLAQLTARNSMEQFTLTPPYQRSSLNRPMHDAEQLTVSMRDLELTPSK